MNPDDCIAIMLPEDADSEYKSRSQIKREMEALQDLGETLVTLKAEQLAAIHLSDKLRDAIIAARAITERGARRRQLQYIGKLMRDVDAEPIRQALDTLNNRGRQAAAQFHRLERWRDRLLNEGDAALSEFIEEHPAADRQRIRQLLRNAQREIQADKPPAAARALFRYLREVSDTEGVEKKQ